MKADNSMKTQPSDRLSELFESVEVDTTVLTLWKLHHPWGVAFPGAHAAILHAVTAGSARFEYADGTVFRLEAGDVLLTNHCIRGAMVSRAGVPLTRFEDLWAERGFALWEPGRSVQSLNLLEFGGQGPQTIMMAVMFDVGEPWRTNLLMKLPPYIHLRRSESVLAPWLEAAVSGLAEENARQPLGYGPIAHRIAEIVLFSCIRSYFADPEREELRWFSALTDRRLAKVLTAVRTQPDHEWTLSELSREAGMSRSTFAARFHEVLAVSPMKFLRDLRMTRAAEALAAGRLTVKEAARRTGYTSASAFSVAFKRKFGAPPHGYSR
jgi:AraC-like DNA-binding protein